MTDDRSQQQNGYRRTRTLRLWGLLAFLTVLVLLGVWFRVARAGAGDHQRLATFVVKEGPLNISVIESGTIKSKEKIILKNEVEGRTSIIALIPEGTYVKKGDLLVELDASTLQDANIDHEIRVQNAQAALVNAQENLVVLKNQAISDVNAAELTLQFARQDRTKYKVGEFPNLETAAQNAINLAEEELTRAQENHAWSLKLFEEEYLSQIELQADKLAVSRSENKLALAQNNLKLLTDFTYTRNIQQLNSDVRQAEMALERMRRSARANVLQAEAELRARELEHKRAQDLLLKIEDQLAKTKIHAPMAGLVIHATSAQSGGAGDGSRQPLDEGQTVFERQELIHLPTTEAYIAEVYIQEANVENVQVGFPVRITVHALPGVTFAGRLASVAPLPDPHFMHMNPNLKLYGSEVDLEGDSSALHTGMSCLCEIVAAEYEKVIYIPVQAVKRLNGESTVQVVTSTGKIEKRSVQVGMDDNRMIHITGGLTPGEVVLLMASGKSNEREGQETGEPNAAHDDAVEMDRRIETWLGQLSEKTRDTGARDENESGPGR